MILLKIKCLTKICKTFSPKGNLYCVKNYIYIRMRIPMSMSMPMSMLRCPNDPKKQLELKGMRNPTIFRLGSCQWFRP